MTIENCLCFCPNDEFVARHTQVRSLDALECEIEARREGREREV
jgi:hypothetical protein